MTELSIYNKWFFMLFLIFSSFLFTQKTQAAAIENSSFKEVSISSKKENKISGKLKKVKKWSKSPDKKKLLALGIMLLIVGGIVLTIGLAGAMTCAIFLSSCGTGHITVGLILSLLGLTLIIVGAI